MTILEYLLKIKELLLSEDRWTKGDLARNSSDELVMYSSVEACKWCLTGATCRVTAGESLSYHLTYAALLEQITFMFPYKFIAEFNDNPLTQFSDVQLVLDQAIANEKKRFGELI